MRIFLSMIWKTHIFGGIQAGIILAAITNPEPKIALMEIGAATLGSILPDIDQQNSKISRSDIALKFVSSKLSKVTKHRREVHTVWASFLFGLLAALFMFIASSASASGVSFLIGLMVAIAIDLYGMKIGIPMGIIICLILPQFIKTPSSMFDTSLIMPIAIAVFLGCISHLVYDSANVQGIMWLHPFKKKRFRYLKIKTDSQDEAFFRVLMIVLTLLLLVILKPFGTQTLYEIFNNMKGIF